MRVIILLSVIDTFSKRTIQILKILSEANEWITIKELAKKLNASEKTIQDDLDMIRKNFNHRLTIEFLPQKGVRIEDFPVNLFLEIQSSILIESTSIKFIIELLKHPKEDLNYYSNCIHVSRSTLYRQLPIINHFLSSYGIYIESHHSLYSLTAQDEYTFRRFFTTFLFEVYQYKTLPFIDDLWITFYKNRLPFIYNQNNESLSDLQLSYYSIYYHFSILREKNGYSLSTISSSLGQKIDFTQEQLTFLDNYNQLPLEKLLIIESSIYIHRHSLFSKTDKLFISETTYFIDIIYSTFSLKNDSITQKLLSDFLIDLCINVKYFQVPYHFFYDRFSPFAQQIKQDHTVIFDTLTQLIKNYSSKVNLDFSLYESPLIYLFIVTLPSVLEANFDKPILIISNYSREHSLFMASTIQKQLSLNPIHFNKNVCIHVADLEKYNLDTFDLVISNTDIISKDTPCILINDFPNTRDIIDIQHFLSANTSLHPEVV